MMAEHAAPEFMAGLRLLGADAHSIPVLEEASERLQRLTGFEVIGVPGLIPEADFFAHLAERRFPVTVWMRSRDELDYLVEPDLLPRFFGHLPCWRTRCSPISSRLLGAIGAHAHEPAALKMLARLYWYTVEFGLVATSRGLRAYGAGILSSSGETIYATKADGPARIAFDLQRVLRTNYLIDATRRLTLCSMTSNSCSTVCSRPILNPCSRRRICPRMRRMPACPKTSRSHRSRSHDAPRLR
jgi:phenylalanine-4-hydroxylase